MPAFLYALRNALLATCCLSAAACIVICGYWESLRWKASHASPEQPRRFEIATYAIGGFSELVTIGLLLAGVKDGLAFFERISVELPLLLVVWILWLVDCALLYSWHTRLYPGGCSAMTEYGRQRCYEYVALGLLCLFNWIILLVYTFTLFACACIGRARGNRVWSRSVKEAHFFSHIPPAPTSVQPGTMTITTSPTPTLLSRISVERIRGGIRKIGIQDYLTHGVSRSNSTASTPSIVTNPLPTAEIQRAPTSHRVSATLQAPVVLEPEPCVPSAAPTRYYDWWDPEITTNETPLRTFTRRLSTISEKLERSGTAKSVSTKRGNRPSSSSSTLVKKKSETPPSSSKGKEGKRDSKRDSDQSFIVMFPCEWSDFLQKIFLPTSIWPYRALSSQNTAANGRYDSRNPYRGIKRATRDVTRSFERRRVRRGARAGQMAQRRRR